MPDPSPSLASARDLLRFIDASPTPYHAVQQAVTRLRAAGFVELVERDAWQIEPGQRAYVVRGGGTLVAFIVGTQAPEASGFVALGAHTDSPNFRVKPMPDVRSVGHRQVGVEVYGGVLHSTWLDRDLTLAGRVSLRGNRHELVHFGRPLARIPSLAIHLHRGVNSEGLVLNAQSHLLPTFGLELAEGGGLLDLLAGELRRGGLSDVDGDQICGFDLALCDAQPSALGGAADEFVFAPRLDNLGSCHAALSALLGARAEHTRTRLVALYDHEESGSQSMAGARSRFLASVLERVACGHPAAERESLARALSRSLLVSADMAHAQHPNYPDKHDKGHAPRFGGGPVIKINASQSYATDGPAEAVFVEACQAAGVTPQRFVSRNDLPCGTTIGPISAAMLGVRTVDVGNPMLSMHSCRELAGSADVAPMIAALGQMLDGAELPASDV